MRTTITIDDDLMLEVERVAAKEQRSRREVLNEALRRGIHGWKANHRTSGTYSTTPRDLGRCLVGSIDGIAETLAVTEGETFR